MFWDRVACVYDIFANVINRRANQGLCAAVAGLILPDDEVLECACGTGLLSGVIVKKCRHLVATDFSAKMLKRAEKKCGKYGNATFAQADILHLDYPDAHFDVVVAANVIHLLEEPYRALQELDRVCKPGGRIVIPTYMNRTKKGSTNRVSNAIGKAGADFKHEFTPETYRQFLTDAGYPDAHYTLCEGRIPCCVALIRKKQGSAPDPASCGMCTGTEPAKKDGKEPKEQKEEKRGKKRMLYAEKLELFRAAHPCTQVTVDGAQFRYMLCGNTDGKTLVFLNGGMNTLEMWMDYVDGMSDDYRVLLFDYPQQLRTNQELVTGMHAFFEKIGIRNPIFVGASDGGMVAQIYVQKYPGETGGLVLASTGGMDANTLKSLKRKYRLAPLMLWYMKHCNYEKLKPRLIKAGMRHIRNESAEEIAYAQNMFETIFKDFTQEKDVHISGLLADLMNQKPVTAADFAVLAGKILLILPDQDFFSGKMQEDLVALMHNPKISYVSGGHLSTVLQTDDYIRTIRAFLNGSTEQEQA